MRIALIALLSLLSLPALADNQKAPACRVADFSAIHFDVGLIRRGTTLTPIAGDAVCPGDRIVTRARGVAVVKFDDGTLITVGHDSEFVITRWKQRRFFSNTASLELVRGAFRAVTGAMTQRKHDFQVKTVYASIGVRGTDFWGGTNISDHALDVVMLSGKGVWIENDAGRVELTTAGTGTTVQPGKAPGLAKEWSSTKLNKAVATITP